LRGLEKLEVGPRATMSGRVRLPGSKSLTNRLLLLSILAEGETVLENVLDSDDIQAMLGAMRALGVTHEVEAEEGVPGALRVKVVGCAGAPPALRRGSGKEAGAELALNLGNAGTAMRPLTAAVALGDTDTLVTLDGVPRMRERPIEDLVVAMKQLGVDCKCTLGTGCPPVAVRASGLRGGRCQLSGKISSQFLTAMLFAAPYASEDVEIEIIDTLVSVPYVEMTVKLMRRWGVNVEVGEGWGSFRIPAGQCYKSPGKAFVEGDASSASYFLAGATVTGSTMVVEGCGKDSLQGDVFFADTMGQMGAQVEWGDTWVKVTGPPKGELKGIDVNMNAMPDAAMTLAVAALFAEGQTAIRDVYNWRVKETERMVAIVTELTKLGATVEEGRDYCVITPPAGGAQGILDNVAIDTYDDHRMAMAFALVALNGKKAVTINDPKCVAKTFPNYFVKFEETTTAQ